MKAPDHKALSLIVTDEMDLKKGKWDTDIKVRLYTTRQRMRLPLVCNVGKRFLAHSLDSVLHVWIAFKSLCAHVPYRIQYL
jgi:hypothetical protein